MPWLEKLMLGRPDPPGLCGRELRTHTIAPAALRGMGQEKPPEALT